MFKCKTTEFGRVYYSDIIPELEHFFTTRNTNVGEHLIDICDYLKIDEKNLIHPTQTHSSNVDFIQKGKTDYPDTDALILTNFEQALYLRFADCTPVIIYDKKANIGAIAHAGWRGTVDDIAVKTVTKMIEHTNTDKKYIYAVIGPAIGGCCYKVGDEVISGIKKTVKNTENIIIQKGDDTYVDLKSANSQQLVEYGIPKENIDICPFCTSCKNDEFFSYRKEPGTFFRHNAVIKLIRKF